jgi:hypothetical protein
MKKYIILLLLLLVAMPCYAQMAGKMKGEYSKGDAVNLNCLSFAGQSSSGDYVSVPANAITNQIYGCTTITWEFWVYIRSTGTSSNGILYYKGVNNYIRTEAQSGSNVKIRSSMAFDVTRGDAQTAVNVLVAVWHHIVSVYNEDGDKKIKIYVDSVPSQIIQTAGATNISDDSASVEYLGDKSTADFAFDGLFKSFRIYRNKALSAAEVIKSYNSGRFASKPVSGCTEEFLFTEGAGNIRDTITNALGTKKVGQLWSKDTLYKGGI